MLEILLTIIASLIAIAFFTIAERKLMASIQRRNGPNVTGFWGTSQAFADGLKLRVKEILVSFRFNDIFLPFSKSKVTNFMLLFSILPDRDIHFTGLIFYYYCFTGLVLCVFSFPVIWEEAILAQIFLQKLKKMVISLVTRNTFLGVVVRSGLFCSYLSFILWQNCDVPPLTLHDPLFIDLALIHFDDFSVPFLFLFRLDPAAYWQICPMSVGLWELFLLFYPKGRNIILFRPRS